MIRCLVQSIDSFQGGNVVLLRRLAVPRIDENNGVDKLCHLLPLSGMTSSRDIT